MVVVEVVVVVGLVVGNGVLGSVGGFEGVVLGQGLVEGSLGGGFVAFEEFEGVGVVAAGAGEAGEEVCGGLVVGEGLLLGVGDVLLDAVAAVGAFDLSLGAVVDLVEEPGLGLGVEAELPGEEGEALDEEVFEGGLGGEGLAEVFEEGGVGGAVGLRDQSVGVEGGSEAVGFGVLS
jgi:hypothetical protein